MYLTTEHIKVLLELLIGASLLIGLLSFVIKPGPDRLFFLFFGMGFLLLLLVRGHSFAPPDAAWEIDSDEVEMRHSMESFIYLALVVGYIGLACGRFVSAVLPYALQLL